MTRADDWGEVLRYYRKAIQATISRILAYNPRERAARESFDELLRDHLNAMFTAREEPLTYDEVEEHDGLLASVHLHPDMDEATEVLFRRAADAAQAVLQEGMKDGEGYRIAITSYGTDDDA